MDYRKFFLNFLQLFFPAGQYGFDNAQWTQRNPNVNSSTEGFALASMMLGIPSFGQISHNPTPASSSSYWASYIQDDWKVSRKLTVNLGLRYEFDIPRTERFNRLSYFDIDAPSPIAGLVPANPFFNPADLRGAAGLRRRQQPPPGRDRSEQLRSADRRRPTRSRTRPSSAPPTASISCPRTCRRPATPARAGMMGFNSQSNMIVSLDGRTPFRTIDNPFPDGFNLPPGNSQGAATFIGLNIGGGNGGVFTTNETPYVQQWNFNVQRELPAQLHRRGRVSRQQGDEALDR